MHALARRLHQVVSAMLLAAMTATLAPVPALMAQDAPMVLILPIDRAQFVPGAYFDLRVEVHAAALPADFTVTINGIEASAYFGSEGIAEAWTIEMEDEVDEGDDEAGDASEAHPVQAMTWRQVSLPEAGAYTVEVTTGEHVTSVDWVAVEPETAVAQNVILFIADGMTIPMISAARLLSQGMTEGKYNGALAMDAFEEFGLVHTSSLDSIMSGSANAASALNTGHKTAINATGTYPDTSPDTLDDPRVETLAELAQRVAGMAIGIVTTADWTDATPAAVFAHTRSRDDAEYVAAAPLDTGMLPQVILGGGAGWMLPEEIEGGWRTDGRNLFDEYASEGYAIATTAAELNEIDTDGTPERLLGLFHASDMNVWLDRNVYTDNLGDYTDQPGLVDMTLAALDVLGTNENGFYLEVEAAGVDVQMHALDWERALADLIEFDQAVAAAVDWVEKNAPDTLIIVTSDHGHGFDVFGTVDVAAFNASTTDNERRAAVYAHADAGYPTYEDLDGDGFPDEWDVSVTLAMGINNHPDYTEDFQVSSTPRIPAIQDEDAVYVDNPDDDPNGIFMSGNLSIANRGSAVHTLQDVPIFASGPGAAAFGGMLDNTEVFFGMVAALGLDATVAD